MIEENQPIQYNPDWKNIASDEPSEAKESTIEFEYGQNLWETRYRSKPLCHSPICTWAGSAYAGIS